MSSILLLSNKDNSAQYLQEYIIKNGIALFEIEYVDGLKVEDARRIKKSLSFRTKNKKLFYFTGVYTIEAQNALLKSIEEHADNVHFIFCAEKEEQLLPTIRSRCYIVKLSGKNIPSEQIEILMGKFYSQPNAKWSIVEQLIVSATDKGIESLLPPIRAYMLSRTNDRDTIIKCYESCRKILALSPLVERNNVSIRSLVESAFL